MNSFINKTDFSFFSGFILGLLFKILDWTAEKFFNETTTRLNNILENMSNLIDIVFFICVVGLPIYLTYRMWSHFKQLRDSSNNQLNKLELLFNSEINKHNLLINEKISNYNKGKEDFLNAKLQELNAIQLNNENKLKSLKYENYELISQGHDLLKQMLKAQETLVFKEIQLKNRSFENISIKLNSFMQNIKQSELRLTYFGKDKDNRDVFQTKINHNESLRVSEIIDFANESNIQIYNNEIDQLKSDFDKITNKLLK